MTNAQNSNTEQDIRLGILNTLLTTPHRKLTEIYPIHQQMISRDPLFYVRLAAWYNDTGEIRDHKEMFIISLCLSDFPGHREVGLAMLRELPPYQVARVVDFIHGRKTKKKVVEKPVTTRGRRASVPSPTVKELVESYGLFKNVPRSVRTEVMRYLQDRERDNAWFDSSVLQARKYLKRLYGVLHIPPGERAQKILFEENPPEDSKLAAFKRLASASTPAEQAEIIVKEKIPFRVASTIVGSMTPTVLLALVEVMSDQELINNLGMLKKRGVFENAEFKKVIESRLDKAKKGKRVAALKATKVADAVGGLSEDLTKKLEEVADNQIKSKGRIKRSTALLIDKSGSMSEAIEIGKQLAATISAVMDANFYVYAFDTMPYPIDAKGAKDLASWEKAMMGIRASGGTSCGCALEYLMRNRTPVEQIIIITDEGDNTASSFTAGYNRYCAELGIKPNVIIVKTRGASGLVEKNCNNQNIVCDSYQFNGDYYSLPNLIPYLTKPGRLDLLMDIMSYELPERKPA